MGRRGRLSARRAAGRWSARQAALVYVLLAAALLGGCEDKVAEQRRELLTPPDKAALQVEKKEQARIKDDQGELLPSDVSYAGFPVPRGFELTKEYTNEWFLRSRVASADATARYVQARVFTGTLERTTLGGYRFESAQLRHDMALPRVAIRISPTRGLDEACELHIRQIPVGKPVERPPADQVEAERRRNQRFVQ